MLNKIQKTILIAIMLACSAPMTFGQEILGISSFFSIDTRTSGGIIGHSSQFNFDTRTIGEISGLTSQFVFDTRTIGEIVGLSPHFLFDTRKLGEIAGLSPHFLFDSRTFVEISGLSPLFVFDVRTNIPISGYSPRFIFDTRIDEIFLALKVYLEGPYNGSEMNTLLVQEIPSIQPYHISPWNYAGTEEFEDMPNTNIVDWILVELRETTGDVTTSTSATTIAKQAAFLLKDGAIVDIHGDEGLSFDVEITDSLYVVIWHRNHLGIMSANALSELENIYRYDFTSSEMQTFGGSNSVKELAPSIWAMISADGNADGIVNVLDIENVWAPQAGEAGYKSGDYNMDTQVNNIDKDDVLIPNDGKEVQVPE